MKKINKYLPFVLKLVFLALLFGFVIFQKAQRPRILVMHSYQTDYAWVNEVNTGLERILDQGHDAIVRYHYMDLKNHTEEDFRRTATATSIQTIEKWQPDVVVLIDDYAQKFVGTKYIDHKSVSVVFAGVNGEIETYGYDKAENVCGILERKPLAAVRETLVMIAMARGFNMGDTTGNIPKVVYIGDKSQSVNSDIETFNRYDWAGLEWLPPLQAGTFDEWKAAVNTANSQADIILISDYRQVHVVPGGKEFVKPGEIIAWTESNSQIPILGMGTVNVLDGGMMMVGASGYEQGEVAAKMALAITEGKSPKDLSVTRTKMFIVAVRKSSMTKRNLPIPSIYEAFARATDNYYE